MSKTKEITEVKEAKKLNKLEIKKETISDLNVQNPDQIKGGTIQSAPPHCAAGTTVIAPSPGGGGGGVSRNSCVCV